MLSKMIKTELLLLFPRAIILDVVVYLISLPFLGLNHEMALGLILGTVIMLIQFALIGISTEEAISRNAIRGTNGKASRHMVLGYFTRYALIGLGIYASFKFSSMIHTVGVIIPLIYPKLVYITGAWLQTIFLLRISKKRKGDEKWMDPK